MGFRRKNTRSAGSTQPANRRRLCFEPLEDRRLLAIIVDTVLDTVDPNDGATSLREAIFAGNTVQNADSIDFAPVLTSAGPTTILLTQGELAITDSITINGPGAELLTIDAQSQSRIFNITATAGDFTIASLTLTGGQTTGNNVVGMDNIFSGGAIRSLTTGLLTIAECAITGNQTSGDGAAGGGVFSIGNVVVMTGNVSDNSTAASGGGIYSRGDISVYDSNISQNRAGLGGGGGLSARRHIVIERSVVSGNTAMGLIARGGGVYSYQGNITLATTRVTNNSTTGSQVEGGGVATSQSNVGIVTITNSIISNNSTFGPGNSGNIGGGGVFALRAIIQNSTISGNSTNGSPSGHGGGVLASFMASIANSTIFDNHANHENSPAGGVALLSASGSLTIVNSIIARNTAGRHPDIFKIGQTSARYSLIGDNDGTNMEEAPLGTPDNNGNLIGGPSNGPINPLLGPLTYNGGPFLADGSPMLTHALLPGSPALNAGNPNAMAGIGGVPLNDQRGFPTTRVAGGRIDMGAYEAQSLSLVVGTLTDEIDGDYSAGDFSLREAIVLANANPGADAISFDPTLTAAGPATIVLTGGELVITDAVTISGPGANLLTIDASGNDPTPGEDNGDGSRMFNVDDDTEATIDVTISGLRLTGGDIRGDGGAIINWESLTVSDCDLFGNAVTHQLGPGGLGGRGAGIANRDGTLVVERSIVRDNRGLSGLTSGGGIANIGGTVRVQDSLVSGNAASAGAGVMSENGSFDVISTAIRDNTVAPFSSSGAGIRATDSALTIVNSSITGNRNASAGGGIYSRGGTLTVLNSTIASNHTLGSYAGAGIYRESDSMDTSGTEIRHSTIVNNRTLSPTATGVGLNLRTQVLATLSQSIVAGNTTGRFIQIMKGPLIVIARVDDNISGTVSAQYSLIGDNTGATILDGGGNQIGTTEDKVDPLLAPLVFNGGSVFLDGSGILTQALLPGSPALDAGDSAAVAGMGDVPLYDQRGLPFTRIVNGDDVSEARIDIGAFEWQPNPLAGDYNYNEVVDAADYVLWRKSVGSANDLRADGDGDGVVDQDDYDVWRANLGRTRAAEPIGSAATAAWQPPALPGVGAATDDPSTTMAINTSTVPNPTAEPCANSASSSASRRTVDTSRTAPAVPSSNDDPDVTLLAWLAAMDHGDTTSSSNDASAYDLTPRLRDTALTIAAAFDEAFAGLPGRDR